MKLLTNQSELSIGSVLLRLNVKAYDLILKDRESGKEHFFQTISYVHELQNLFHDFTGSSPSFPINLEFAVTKKATSSF